MGRGVQDIELTKTRRLLLSICLCDNPSRMLALYRGPEDSGQSWRMAFCFLILIDDTIRDEYSL